jgi:ribosome-associated protein
MIQAPPPAPIRATDIYGELIFSASRSGGPGGQNVNKVSTKITLKWDVARSQLINQEQRELLLQKLASRIRADGVLMIISQEARSQLQNKEEAVNKLEALLENAFKQRKIRKPSKPSKTVKRKRVENKRKHAEKKVWRRRVE